MRSEAFYIVSIVIEFITQCVAQTVVRGGMVASSLRFVSIDDQSATPPALIFGAGENEVRMRSHPDAGLYIETPLMSLMQFKPDNTIEIGAQQLITKSGLDLQGPLRVHQVSQWILVHKEDLTKGKAIGWDNQNTDLVTECAGIYLLGGYGKFSKGEVTKQIADLPPHDEIRIKANFHFIDAWVGETGFMRLNIGKDGSMVYVWTDRHNQASDSYAVNVCGTGVGEGKFSVPIDVVINHAASSIIVGFGSTIEKDAEKLFKIKFVASKAGRYNAYR